MLLDFSGCASPFPLKNSAEHADSPGYDEMRSIVLALARWDLTQGIGHMSKARQAAPVGQNAYKSVLRTARKWCGALLVGGTLLSELGYGQEGGARTQKPQPTPFVLRHAKAEYVAPELRDALSGMSASAEVVADVRRNRVLVRGDRNVIAAAAELIEELDTFQEPEEFEPALKPFARGYSVEPAALEATLQSLRELYRDQPGVSVNADKRSSRIVVFGPPQVHQEVVQALDAAALAPAPRQTAQRGGARGLALARPSAPQRLEPVHRFRNLSWQDFEDALEQIWGGNVEVTPDANGDSAEVRLTTRDGETHFLRVDRNRNQLEAGDPEPVAKWKQIARVLDGLETKAGQEAQLMTVANTKPAHLKEVVYALQQPGTDKGRRPLISQALRRDPRNARWGGDIVSRVFQQDPARQPAGADPVQPPEDDEQFNVDDFTLDGDVQIEYVEGLDLLIIRGNPSDVEKVKKLISLLDKESQVEPELRVVMLENTNNEVLAPLLTQINDQVLAARQGRVTIIPLGKPNAILLLGQQTSVDVMVKYIRELDVETPPEGAFKIFRLRYMSAVDAELAIRDFFSNRPGQQQTGGAGTDQFRPGLGTRPRIIADTRSNSLVVQGGLGDIRDVEALLRELDVEDSASQVQIRVFPLRRALASELAPTLQAAITGQGTQTTQPGAAQNAPGGQQRPVTPRLASLQFVQVTPNGTQVIDSGIPTNVVVEADASSNRLIVRGPARTMELIERLIEQLDQPAGGGASIRVFRVAYGDAQQIFTNLQQLFGTTTQLGGVQGGALSPATSEGETPLVGLRFTYDPSSNSIIATGNPGDLDMVQAVLDSIDVNDMPQRTLAVYRLVNNDAQFVANAITTIINTQQQTLRTQAQANFLIPARRLLEEDVFVTPELVTNSVIISATPRKLEEVRRVIQQLDLRQPMVLVQMLIAEVSLQNDNELGAELGLQDSVLFDRGIGQVGFPFNNAPLGNTLAAQQDAAARGLLAPQALSSFNLGRTSANRGYGGLVLSASSESVSILIRALHERNRLQILSRPEVMTVDRIPANVLVGEDVPLLGSVSQGINGNIGSVDRQQVGLSMIVIPQVNADGQIVIDVNATRSSLGALSDGIPIPAGDTTVLQPRINITQAVSTVSCRSGQTVIMSGLITKTRSLQERGIPGLMDIPYVGRLFQFRAEQERRTELLMILTPHIIWDGDDLEWVKQTEAERMSWCLADVADLDGDRGYPAGKGLWGSLRHRTIFPHVQPRGVAECTPPPGPLDPLQKIQARLNPDCPPDPMWQAPPGTGMPPEPPSSLEGRSYYGPTESPHQLFPPELSNSRNRGLEEVPPVQYRSRDEEDEYAPPPPSEGAMLKAPSNSESRSMRSALQSRSGSTRRAEYQSEEDYDYEVERTSYEPAPRSRATAPTGERPRQNPPASRDVEARESGRAPSESTAAARNKAASSSTSRSASGRTDVSRKPASRYSSDERD